MTGTLLLFVKEPRAGRVKTRLGREIGMTAACWWFRHQTAALIRRLGRDARWRTILVVAPDLAVGSRAWPADLPRRPQGRGDLGARMARALRAAGPGPVVLIGADIPGVRPAHIAGAFALLGRHDAVLGPAPDGGFWLVGLRRPAAAPAMLFRDVRWSGPHAMADTVRSMDGLSIGTAATLSDVDTAADLAAAAETRWKPTGTAAMQLRRKRDRE